MCMIWSVFKLELCSVLIKRYSCGQVKEGEMAGACCVCVWVRTEKCTKFWGKMWSKVSCFLWGPVKFLLIFNIFGLIWTKFCRDNFHRNWMELCAFHATQFTAICCTSAAARVLLGICEFCEHHCREGCTFHMCINAVTLMCILWNCMVFWN
jgi:hypothetical protein